MQRVTLDTNTLPADDLAERAAGKPFEFARISVTDRELENAPPHVHVAGTVRITETAVWGEASWNDAEWASDSSPLEEILSIISDGSFPSDRSNLKEGELRQLRDAMILEAHLRANRDILVTNDERAFVRNDKRERLEARFGTKILTTSEFEAQLR